VRKISSLGWQVLKNNEAIMDQDTLVSCSWVTPKTLPSNLMAALTNTALEASLKLQPASVLAD